MTYFLEKLNQPIYKHLLFWLAVFLFYTTSARERFNNTEELIVTYFFHVLFQMFIAYVVLYFIVPQYKKNKRISQVIIIGIVLFFVTNFMYVSVRMFLLEPAYPDCYTTFIERYGNLTFWERIFNWRHVFFNLPLFYLQPLFFLGALLSYEKQYKLSEISEQKKTVELQALKHQLNPHFLFNTLNNLYTLSLEKSDVAPEVIEKLSGILDYMLYGCEEKYVAIEKEIKLIENYLALEQIRYEDRVVISFKNSVDENVKIAPLLLLTFIENAFKHGVSQELAMATVDISIALDSEDIIFTIMNTKPAGAIEKPLHKKRIGLTNIEKQLALLYPNEHHLSIDNSDKIYNVILKLKHN